MHFSYTSNAHSEDLLDPEPHKTRRGARQPMSTRRASSRTRSSGVYSKSVESDHEVMGARAPLQDVFATPASRRSKPIDARSESRSRPVTADEPEEHGEAANKFNTTGTKQFDNTSSPQDGGARRFIRRLSHQIIDSIDEFLPIPKAVAVTMRHRKEQSKKRRLGALRRKQGGVSEVHRYAHDLAEDQEYWDLLQEIYRGHHSHLLPMGVLLSTLAVSLLYLGLHFYLRSGKFFVIFLAANTGLIMSRLAYLYWVSISQINATRITLDTFPFKSDQEVEEGVEDEDAGTNKGVDPVSFIQRVVLRAKAQEKLMDQMEEKIRTAKKPEAAVSRVGGLLNVPFAEKIPFVDVKERFKAEYEAEKIADQKFGKLEGGPTYASEMILDPHGGPGPSLEEKAGPVRPAVYGYMTPIRSRHTSRSGTPVRGSLIVRTPGSAKRTQQYEDGSTIQRQSPYLSALPSCLTSIVYTLGPIALMIVSPLLAFMLVLSVMNGKPNLMYLLQLIGQPNMVKSIINFTTGNAFAWTFWAIFLSIQALLMIILPGELIEGTRTKGGYRPVFRLNGLLSFFVSIVLVFFAFVKTEFSIIGFVNQSSYVKTALLDLQRMGVSIIDFKTTQRLFSLFSPSLVYDNIPYILGTGTLLVLVTCVFLYVKAFILPTSTDSVFFADSESVSGNPVFDFYSGAELYPTLTYPTSSYFKRLLISVYNGTIGCLSKRIQITNNIAERDCWFKFQIKTFIHSRVGMTLWAILALIYLLANIENASAGKQLTVKSVVDYFLNAGKSELAIVLSSLIHILFVFRHYYWEGGYLASTDIVHDHEGFYLAYGCAIFMPFTFTLPILYLVKSSSMVSNQLLSSNSLIALFAVSTLFMMMNYIADEQKIRARKEGEKCRIFGKPVDLIKAGYFDSLGNFKESYLLCSGFWGVARHFHYTLDWAWVFVSLFISGKPSSILTNNVLLFYPVFLLAIFIDRAIRDDLRCARKYGSAWSAYREKVPYRMFPKIF